MSQLKSLQAGSCRESHSSISTQLRRRKLSWGPRPFFLLWHLSGGTFMYTKSIALAPTTSKIFFVLTTMWLPSFGVYPFDGIQPQPMAIDQVFISKRLRVRAGQTVPEANKS